MFYGRAGKAGVRQEGKCRLDRLIDRYGGMRETRGKAL